MKIIALTLAFLLELVAFTFFAGIAYTFDINKYVQALVAVLLFVLLIAFWSLFMAPKAPKKVGALAYYLYKTAIYAMSAVSIFNLTNTYLLYAFVVAVLLDEVVLFRHNLQTS